MKKIIQNAFSVIAITACFSSSALADVNLWGEPGSCDRDCLIDMADQYIAAMVAGDRSAAPFSGDVKYTENTEVMNLGEGLWVDSKSSSDSFNIYVPDPVSNQIGFMTVIETDDGEHAQLGLRLKVENAKITEVEHMTARNLNENIMVNFETPRNGLVTRVPSGNRISRELMLVIAASYYDAVLQSNGSATLFADDCERRENGMITSGGDGPGFGGGPQQGCFDQMNSRGLSYITSIDLQRVEIADPVTGLVFALSHFRHAFETKELQVFDQDGNVTPRTMDYEPFDFPAVHIQKIEDYKIHEQEAMGYSIPYRSTNGWNQFWR